MITEHDYKLIDEYSIDGTGWARFSADQLQRYRLGRLVTTRPRAEVTLPWVQPAEWQAQWIRVVFVMLNPSTADAFKLDPTVARCVKFAQLWGADIVEVVNLFAFRSTYPKDLRTAIYRGDGPENDRELMAACRGAHRVVASWGQGGDLYGRGEDVAKLLRDAGIALHHLGITNGQPKHPLARGKHFIPYSKELEVF